MGVACLEFRGENFRGWLKNREICEIFSLASFLLYGISLDCCMQGFIRSHLTLSKPSRAFKDLTKSLRCRCTTACIDSPSYSSKN